ncbi:hypothetical protein QBC37DRAFT_463268 [Rhypophila decipiens]|uniref:Alkyl hydroperoxide reductase subunit C/ Thiol specific antioxidant domain-containing protein n=1 Tax=Rhypophila decipiens TaxID=261697 RepID=A0AAN6YGM1_9PEZI|nr:hypothetical protein QBC37DRAFT_463268 [Rhypophila decipiens]
MFSNLATKMAFKKMGLPSDPLNSINSVFTTSEPEPPKKQPKKLTKTNNNPNGSTSVPGPGQDDPDQKKATWPAWMSIKSLPLTVQPWLTPTPPPIPIADPPRVGDLAPLDSNRTLTLGGGKLTLVVFLRCVGCAFAQKQFLALRTLATKYPGQLDCIAVSHSSPAATRKWLDLLGGAWNVTIVIDEDRAVYAAWGLGLGSVWYVLNPQSQVAGFKEKGWLGASVAVSLERTGVWKAGSGGGLAVKSEDQEGPRQMMVRTNTMGNGAAAAAAADLGAGIKEEGPTTLMGNKWQQSGCWAVDGRGKIVWGGKAARADEVMDLEAGVAALGLA